MPREEEVLNVAGKRRTSLMRIAYELWRKVPL